MLARDPKFTAAQNKQRKRRADQRRWTREHREREREGLALYHVVIDGEMLDLLVRRGYLQDAQTTDKELVNAGLSQFLWDAAHAK